MRDPPADGPSCAGEAPWCPGRGRSPPASACRRPRQGILSPSHCPPHRETRVWPSARYSRRGPLEDAIKAADGFPSGGAVAQLGARLDGIEEVVGSNPIGSTNLRGSSLDTWVTECTGYMGSPASWRATN